MNLKIAVFGSGKGSNFKSILEFLQSNKISAEIKLVISNNSSAGILEIARQNNILGIHLSNKQFDSDAEFSKNLLNLLNSNDINFIVLAGYMKKISSEIISSYKNRIINIHPALIPSFCGKDMYGSKVHSAVLEYGCKVSGATVHLVDEEYDHGAILLQKAVEVENDDTPETLAAKILKIEHTIYPQAIKLFAEDKIIIEGRKVKILK